MVQSWLLIGREKLEEKNVFRQDAVGGGWLCRRRCGFGSGDEGRSPSEWMVVGK